MELTTDREFYPAVSTWHLLPRLMGPSTKIPWLAAGDFGALAAQAIAEPGGYVGKDLKLASELCSSDACRSLFRSVLGRPPRVPMPEWRFERFVGTDLTTVWRWLRTGLLEVDPGRRVRSCPGHSP